MVDKKTDILIIGGGLTGALLNLALKNSGYSCLIADSHPPGAKINPDFDARTLALSPSSIRILQMLNLWPLLSNEATPITSIHVSDKGRFGSATIRAKQDPPLGFVVEIQHINQAIENLMGKNQLLPSTTLRLLDKNKGLATLDSNEGELLIQAKLIVAADGTESATRRLAGFSATTKDYKQEGLVSNIELARAHQNKAYERFTPSGPLALLPMTKQRMSLVWALSPSEASRLLALEEQSFLTELQKAFGYRLGRFIRVGKRTVYPLQLLKMSSKAEWPLVFVGNAAQTLHPVAGQGFNLGLRDVASLAQCILQEGLTEKMLVNYQKMRQHDGWAITQFTDRLIEVFTSRIPGIGLARNLGLIAVDNFNILKRCLSHYTGGFAGFTPDLVCGIRLNTEEY